MATKCSINSEVSGSHNGLDVHHIYHFSTPPERTAKQIKTHHYSPEVVVEITDRNGKLKPIRASLDTSTSATILLRDFVRKGRAKTKCTKNVEWSTMGGTIVTKYQSLIEFMLLKFSDKKKVTHMVNVDGRTKQKHASFDMIIGMHLMTEQGLVIDLDNKSIRWKELKIELKPRAYLVMQT